MTKQWPTLTIVFENPPPEELWDIFCARAQAETECLGIQDVPPSPKEPYAGAPRVARLFFPSRTDGDAPSPHGEVKELASAIFADDVHQWEEEPLEDQDWGENWRRYFKTNRVGERLYVGPPWEGKLPADAPANAKLVQIDPGQAFGTGSHETTRLCMRLLEIHNVPGGCLADIGAGSGILSIAALHLGEAYAIGIEYDAVCEENFYINAELNKVREKMVFVLGADPWESLQRAIAEGAPEPDHIVCNMLSERFYPLLPAMRKMNKPLILSGFLLTETPTVESNVAKAGFVIEKRYDLDEWGAFLCAPAE